MKRHAQWISVTFAVIIIMSGCGKKESVDEASHAETQRIHVRTTPLMTSRFQRVIQVQGVIRPVQSATISARQAGVLESLDVREGSRVRAGDVLFETDQKNLANQVMIAEQTLRVAKENRLMMQSDVEAARTDYDRTNSDYEREKTLFERSVISKKDYETAEASWKKSKAMMEKAETSLSYQDAVIVQAETNLEIARKNQSDSIVRAPYDGVVTAKLMDVGEYASAGSDVLTLEDSRHLELSVYLSSLYHPFVSRETRVTLSMHGKSLCEASLSYISPTIDSKTRTFEIKAALPEDSGLVSGSLCDVDIVLEAREGVGVPSEAVLPRRGGIYSVFAECDGHAEEIEIQVGMTTDGYTEIMNAESLSGRAVVVSGQHFLSEGSLVEVDRKEDHP